MRLALVFPGQGSQKPGMGKSLADSFVAARRVFEEVDEALEQKLSKLIFAGSEADLRRTENAQPALMAVGMAVLAVLRAEVGAASKFVLVAGHSLGEYSALAAAGALSLGDAARVLRARGLAMQRAVPGDAGVMSAVLGAELAAVEKAAADAADASGAVCVVANDNAPGQVVLSGNTGAVELAEVAVKAVGAKRTVRLEVAAAFHSPLMEPAAGEMQRVLAAVVMKAPSVPLVANVTAAQASDPTEIRALLVRQITGRVRWRESVAHMAAAGVDTLLELGAGKVLAGLARRIEPAVVTHSVETPDDVAAFARVAR